MRQCIVDGSMKDIQLQAGIPDVGYVDMAFDNFSAREVTIDGNSVGEFHLNFRCMDNRSSVNYIQSKVSGEISLIDPEDVLKLEYNIYIKVDPQGIEAMTMGDIFNQMDEEITEKGN